MPNVSGCEPERRIHSSIPASFGASSIWNTGLQVYGFGIAQGLDNAATVLYLSYRHVQADLTLRDNATGVLGNANIEDLDLVNAGAIIKF